MPKRVKDTGSAVKPGARPPELRNRVKALKVVPAGELLANPHNWRVHPSNQAVALRKMLDRVGFVDPILVRETPKGYVIIDGHLRTGVAENQNVPIVVLDVNEEEAKLILATVDPINSMGKGDWDIAAQLTKTLTKEDQARLSDVLEQSTYWGIMFPDQLASLQRELDAGSKIKDKLESRKGTFKVEVLLDGPQKAVFESALESAGVSADVFLIHACRAYLRGVWKVEHAGESIQKRRAHKVVKALPQEVGLRSGNGAGGKDRSH